MESLAIELLERILILACTDGGFTGSSLSRVSKYIRAVSHSARFYTVAILSPKLAQIAQFHACYARERNPERGATPRVRHLFLVSAVRHVDPASAVCPRVKGGGDLEQRKLCAAVVQQSQQQAREVVHEEQRKFSENVNALLRLVAPDLHTLTLLHCHRYRRVELRLPDTIECPGGFPLLRELTIAGYEPEFVSPEGNGVLDTLFPSLTRLHILLVALVGRPTLDIAGWVDRAPSLTHLRITNPDFWPKTTMEAVKKVFESEHANDCLKRIIVQPHCPPPMGGPCGTPPSVFGSFMTKLDDLCRSSSVPATLLPPNRDMKERDWEAVMVRDWADRLQGGLGCWDVDAVSKA